jgi:hypothetical protein
MPILLQRFSKNIRAKLSLVQPLYLCILIMAVGSNAAASMRAGDNTGSYSQNEFAAIQETLFNWLECEECTSTQLKAVAQLGPKALPFLKSAFTSGPSDSRLRKLALHLRQEYKKMQEYQASHLKFKIPLSETQYVETHVVNFMNQYRTNAEIALVSIGGPEAIDALKKSLNDESPNIGQDAVGAL